MLTKNEIPHYMVNISPQIDIYTDILNTEYWIDTKNQYQGTTEMHITTDSERYWPKDLTLLNQLWE